MLLSSEKLLGASGSIIEHSEVRTSKNKISDLATSITSFGAPTPYTKTFQPQSNLENTCILNDCSAEKEGRRTLMPLCCPYLYPRIFWTFSCATFWWFISLYKLDKIGTGVYARQSLPRGPLRRTRFLFFNFS